jgi:TRAP-type C4-dicarboxylate transport system substrate-binding protein
MAGLIISPEPGYDASGAVIKLRYADQNPQNGWEAVQAAQPWLNQIQAATNGRVQITPYYSESLTKGASAWNATQNNIVDMAWMFHGYWADQAPLANVVSLPFLPFTSAKQASGILWQLYEQYPSIRSEFQDNHILLMWASTPYFLVTVNKQVKTPEDIKGLKIRVPNGPMVEIFKSLGAIPITIGMPDTYLYLQKGIIDGMTISWESLVSFHQYEVAKYYNYFPMFTVYFSQAMNNKTWNNLPSDVQAQINSVCGLKGSLFWGEYMFDSVAQYYEEQKKDYHMSEYNLSADEMADWNDLIGQPLWQKWVKDMTVRGHPEAQDILNTCLELINTYQP